MKNRLLSLLLVVGVGVGAAACDDDPVTRPLSGTVTGTVSAGGEPLVGVSLSLEGEVSQTNITRTDGSYAFEELPEGTYTVSITDVEQDVVFNPDQKVVTISLTNPDATANFDGTFTSN